jgi:quercetin dioxygenase-like cupin family protein
MDIIIALLIILCFFMWLRCKSKQEAYLRLGERVETIEKETIEKTNRILLASTLNTTEMNELLVEGHTSAYLSSNLWNTTVSYGKWSEFTDTKGNPPSELRAFWPSSPGKIIGVKMPVGSSYKAHNHPWKETLIGLSGKVLVHVTMKDGTLRELELSEDKVVEIPSNMDHAVMEAEVESRFICIWGKPTLD